MDTGTVLHGKNPFDLSGKIVLITGAGAGLGEGYAHIFAESGAVPVCAGHNLNKVEKVAADLIASGARAGAVHVDVGDLASIQRMMDSVTAEYGRVDVLVNNAGVEIAEDFFDVTPEHFDAISRVNIRGVFFTAQAVAGLMKKTGTGGKIINIGSLGSFIGLADSSVYTSTKGAVIQLTKTLALELAKYNIQVNAVAPGYFITPMTQAFFDDPRHREWIEGRIPLGRWGTMEDLAGPLLFLASGASNYVTGETIIVDGGWLAG
jgi:NAD(P)-dependent dehydrogenase (short-subunit alcohol dehydrogenase family)